MKLADLMSDALVNESEIPNVFTAKKPWKKHKTPKIGRSVYGLGGGSGIIHAVGCSCPSCISGETSADSGTGDSGGDAGSGDSGGSSGDGGGGGNGGGS